MILLQFKFHLTGLEVVHCRLADVWEDMFDITNFKLHDSRLYNIYIYILYKILYIQSQ